MGFSRCNGQFRASIQFHQSPSADASDAPWQLYVNDDPSCQPRRSHIPATTPLSSDSRCSFPSHSAPCHQPSLAGASPRPRPAQARSSPRLRPSSPARSSARVSSTPASPPLRQLSSNEETLPRSSNFDLVGDPPCSPATWPELPGPPPVLILVPIAFPCHAGAHCRPQPRCLWLSTLVVSP